MSISHREPWIPWYDYTNGMNFKLHNMHSFMWWDYIFKRFTLSCKFINFILECLRNSANEDMTIFFNFVFSVCWMQWIMQKISSRMDTTDVVTWVSWILKVVKVLKVHSMQHVCASGLSLPPFLNNTDVLIFFYSLY